MVDRATNETVRTGGAVGYMCNKEAVDSMCIAHVLVV